MNTPLHDAYRELGKDSRDYARPDRALAVLRRRRTGQALAAASLVVAVSLGGVGLYDRLFPPSITASSYASRPQATAPPLPAGEPVGHGTLVYTECTHGCPTFLVVDDDRRYLLGEQTVSPPGNITLSPDGRWLGLPTERGYQLRDLTGTAVRHIERPATTGVFSPWVWSPDSGRLIVGHHVDGDVGAYVELDLATGRTGTPDVPSGYEPVGFLSSGELLLLEERLATRSSLSRVRLLIGNTGRAIVLDTGRPEVEVMADSDHGLWIQVSGDRIFSVGYTAEETTLLQFNPVSDLVTREILAPGEVPVGPVDGGFAIMTDSGGRTRELVKLSGTGRQRLREVSSEASVVLRGGTRH